MNAPKEPKPRRAKGEGAIYQDPKTGRYHGQLDLGRDPVTGRRVRRKVTGKTRTEVSNKLKAARKDHEERDATKRSPTVADVARKWLEHGAPGARKPRREEGSLSVLTWKVEAKVIGGLGHIRIDKLTPDDVEAWLQGLADTGVTTVYLRDLRGALRQILIWAAKRKLVRDAYAATAATIPEGAASTPKVILTEDERERFYVALAGHQLEPYLTVMAELGLRPGEADGLQWHHVNLDERIVAVEQVVKRNDKGDPLGFGPLKTATIGGRRERVLELTDRCVRVLRKWRVQQVEARLRAGEDWQAGEWGDLVFTNRDGAPLRHSHVRKILKKVCTEADLPNVVPYGLRHTATTILSDHVDGDLMRVADQLGHVNTKMVQEVYRHRPAVIRTAAVVEAKRLAAGEGGS